MKNAHINHKMFFLKEDFLMANFDQQLKDLNKEGIYGSQEHAQSTFA